MHCTSYFKPLGSRLSIIHCNWGLFFKGFFVPGTFFLGVLFSGTFLWEPFSGNFFPGKFFFAIHMLHHLNYLILYTRSANAIRGRKPSPGTASISEALPFLCFFIYFYCFCCERVVTSPWRSCRVDYAPS